jgi:hypothetical protein
LSLRLSFSQGSQLEPDAAGLPPHGEDLGFYSKCNGKHRISSKKPECIASILHRDHASCVECWLKSTKRRTLWLSRQEDGAGEVVGFTLILEVYLTEFTNRMSGKWGKGSIKDGTSSFDLSSWMDGSVICQDAEHFWGWTRFWHRRLSYRKVGWK